MGVPPFTVGVGDYKDDAYNFFVNQAVRGVASVIEQEMTRKLILNPAWHVQLNPRSLYNYKLSELVTAGKELDDEGRGHGRAVSARKLSADEHARPAEKAEGRRKCER